MSTIDPALRVDCLSPLKVQGSGKRSRLAFYLLRLGEALSLVAFLSFCVMWVQRQAATPGVSRVSGDFVSFWTAGQLALDGRAADAYRYQPHLLAQLALHAQRWKIAEQGEACAQQQEERRIEVCRVSPFRIPARSAASRRRSSPTIGSGAVSPSRLRPWRSWRGLRRWLSGWTSGRHSWPTWRWLGVIAAAAALFAVVLRRMTEQPAQFQATAAVVPAADKFSASATPSGI